MPIPEFTADGVLPEGVHDCTLDEIREQFGSFQRTDARCRLFEQLEAFIKDARASRLVIAVIVDGSFVTDKDDPGDVDVIVVLRSDHDFTAMLRPFEYNVVSSDSVRRMFRIDALVGQEGGRELEDHMALFGRVRGTTGIKKGMLRLGI